MSIKKKIKSDSKTETAIFAMGCFWGVQTLFDLVNGIISTRVGYTGGSSKNPTYKEVCSDLTGHIESIEIIFNPKIISYHELLEIFWKNHDPTTPNRQGPDIGSQYRSAIFYHSEKQKAAAIKSKEEKQKSLLSKKIITEISKADKFYPAEEYHQKYLEKKGLASCRI